jgi:4'-phosphopantetheinyl transferase
VRSLAPNNLHTRELDPPPSLPPTVRLWCLRLDVPDAAISELQRCLSSDELERARRFRVPEAQRQFIVVRSALRTLLGEFTNLPAAEVRFEYSAIGKPFVPASPDLHFNVSHSGELGLVALARRRQIGVDVELLQDRPELREIARSFWTPSEWEALESVGTPHWCSAFYRMWTRKEAVLKAAGKGIATGLYQPDLSASLHGVGLLAGLQVKFDETEWQLYDLAFHPQYAAAMAIETLGETKPSVVPG